MVPISLAPSAASQTPDVPARAQSTKASDPLGRDLAKLGKAAGDFEAMLLNSLWQSMKGTFASEDGEGSEGQDDPILGSFDDWGMQALSQAAGSVGALGFKALILAHLSPLIASSEPVRE